MPKNMISRFVVGFAVLMVAGCASSKAGTKEAAPQTTGGGITTRAYIADKERVDQDMQGGNYGYVGGAPKAPDRSDLKKTRKVYVMEVTKETPEVLTQETTVTTSTKSMLPPDLQEQPRKPAPRHQPVVIPRIDDEATSAVKSSGPTSEQQYTIGKGDTLQKISKKFYGSFSKWNKIYEANKDVIKDPNRVKVGTTIKIPVLE